MLTLKYNPKGFKKKNINFYFIGSWELNSSGIVNVNRKNKILVSGKKIKLHLRRVVES
jgi:hypothetical protein